MRMGTATEQQNKVPELRFSEFSDGWQSRKLNDVISLVVDNRGKTPPTITEGIPMIEVNAIGDKKIDYTKVGKFVDQDTFENWFRKYLEPGDVLFSTVGATALCSIYEEQPKSVIAQNIVGLRFDEMDSSFAFYLLTEPRNNHKFKRIQMGAVQPSVKVSQMIHIYFDVPERAEQQKIADFLGSVDAWLDNLRSQKTALETYKQGMMQKLFTQQVRFKDDNGNDFPEWVTVKLGDLGEVKTSSVDKLSNAGESEVNLLNYMDVYRRDHVRSSDEFQTVTATDRERSTFNLKAGDILFTPSSETPTDIGHSAVVMEDLNNVLYSYHLLRFRPTQGVFEGGFGGYAFKSYKFYKELWRRAQGATRYTLSLESIKEAEVIYPASIDEQKKITDFLTTIDQTITAKAEEITKVEQWKKGLMQKMFV